MVAPALDARSTYRGAAFQRDTRADQQFLLRHSPPFFRRQIERNRVSLQSVVHI